jgi:hypothetical protein
MRLVCNAPVEGTVVRAQIRLVNDWSATDRVGQVWQTDAELVPEISIGALDGADAYMLGHVMAFSPFSCGCPFRARPSGVGAAQVLADGIHITDFRAQRTAVRLSTAGRTADSPYYRMVACCSVIRAMHESTCTAIDGTVLGDSLSLSIIACIRVSSRFRASSATRPR